MSIIIEPGEQLKRVKDPNSEAFRSGLNIKDVLSYYETFFDYYNLPDETEWFIETFISKRSPQDFGNSISLPEIDNYINDALFIDFLVKLIHKDKNYVFEFLKTVAEKIDKNDLEYFIYTMRNLSSQLMNVNPSAARKFDDEFVKLIDFVNKRFKTDIKEVYQEDKKIQKSLNIIIPDEVVNILKIKFQPYKTVETLKELKSKFQDNFDLVLDLLEAKDLDNISDLLRLKIRILNLLKKHNKSEKVIYDLLDQYGIKLSDNLRNILERFSEDDRIPILFYALRETLLKEKPIEKYVESKFSVNDLADKILEANKENIKKYIDDYIKTERDINFEFLVRYISTMVKENLFDKILAQIDISYYKEDEIYNLKNNIEILIGKIASSLYYKLLSYLSSY